MSATSSLYDSIETVDLVGGVGDLADVTVRLNETVGAVDDAVLQRLMCVLLVPGVWVCYSV